MKNIRIFRCAKVFTPEAILNNAVIEIRDGKIGDITEGSSVSGDAPELNFLNAAPGMVDIHIQGCGGFDFLDAAPESVAGIRKTALFGGCTSLLATTTFDNEPGAFERLEKMMGAIREGSAIGQGARIVGIHMEGPYINILKKGGFGKRYFRKPGRDDFMRMCDIIGDTLKMITIAPELPGGLEIIQEAQRRGIVVSIGHSVMNYEMARDAFNSGVNHITHIFNAMTGLHHRKPGLIGAALEDENVFVQIIPDGIHVHPAVLRLLFRIKGSKRLCLITDATAPCGMKEGESMEGVGGRIMVKDGGVRLADGTLAGSALLMDSALRRMFEYSGASLSECIEMASTTPATSIGMQDKIGVIRKGLSADFILFDDALKIHYIIIRGELVSLERNH